MTGSLFGIITVADTLIGAFWGRSWFYVSGIPRTSLDTFKFTVMYWLTLTYFYRQLSLNPCDSLTLRGHVLCLSDRCLPTHKPLSSVHNNNNTASNTKIWFAADVRVLSEHSPIVYRSFLEEWAQVSQYQRTRRTICKLMLTSLTFWAPTRLIKVVSYSVFLLDNSTSLSKHHDMKAYRGLGVKYPCIPGLSSKGISMVILILWPLYFRGNSPWSTSRSDCFNPEKEAEYPLNRRLDGPQCGSGCGGEEKKFLFLPEIKFWLIASYLKKVWNVSKHCAKENTRSWEKWRGLHNDDVHDLLISGVLIAGKSKGSRSWTFCAKHMKHFVTC